MKWKKPTTKIYEALGAVADGRVEGSNIEGKVYSSTGNKFYTITFEPESNSIMSNDNASYWKGYLGYPSIAFLMKNGVLSYSKECGDLLKGIPWKDINQKYKNDFEKALDYILLSKTEMERNKLKDFVEKLEKEVKDLKLNLLGKKTLPPEGY
ncbi:MAG: hypothetical protein CEO12_532 [Parcubacteria group bacterium Gr01-1014_46]|nr:MAG: hypothetical protein CEO12_532 [Parcubacteria group bacterium Gr01-1014_46]